jgi:hypothetical protein
LLYQTYQPEYDAAVWLDRMTDAFEQYNRTTLDDDEYEFSYIIYGEEGYRQHPISAFGNLQQVANTFNAPLFFSQRKRAVRIDYSQRWTAWNAI